MGRLYHRRRAGGSIDTAFRLDQAPRRKRRKIIEGFGHGRCFSLQADASWLTNFREGTISS
ncbi:MAG: hypothetical protein WBE72_06030 [Terracidiphilus sp.]